jgi:cold shock protein
MRTGVCVKWFRDFGFIVDDDDNRDYFIHYSNINGSGFKKLEVGDVVSFQLEDGPQGRLQAVDVSVIGGMP